MHTDDAGIGRYRKASASSGGNGNSCVLVGHNKPVTTIGVRDSKDYEGGRLTFGRADWAAFTAAIS